MTILSAIIALAILALVGDRAYAAGHARGREAGRRERYEGRA